MEVDDYCFWAFSAHCSSAIVLIISSFSSAMLNSALDFALSRVST
jgi:hypothetical protein